VTVADVVAAGQRIALRADVAVDAGTGAWEVSFYTAAAIDRPWTLVGSDTGTLSGTALFNSTAPVTVGAAGDGAAPAGPGTVFSAAVYDTGVAVANPNFAVHSAGTASFVDDAGRTWTMQGTAVVTGSEQATITPDLAGQVWLKSIRWPFLNRVVNVVNWSDVVRPARTTIHDVAGRSVPVAVHDKRSSPQFTLTVVDYCTRGRVEVQCADGEPLVVVRDLDLVLAAGGTMFIHVPAGSAVPGGYVAIGDTSMSRVAEGNPDTSYLFTLPCTVVAPPGADVVGGTMVYAELLELYGGYNSVLAANPTYAALLDLMASPDSLVVL
jgi:hypothetical protein